VVILDRLTMIFLGPERIPAEARPDLEGLVPWPVFSNNSSPPRFWRLEEEGDWMAPIEVTDQVRSTLEQRFTAHRQRTFREAKERAARLKDEAPERPGEARATQIRRDRGDVKATILTEIDKIGTRTDIKVQMAQDWLKRHFRRGEISKVQFAAGVRFQRTSERVTVGVPSQLDPDKLDAPRGTGTTPDLRIIALAEVAAAASGNFRAALDAMGPVLWPVVLWVVVSGRSAAEWAKSAGKPQTDGIAALRLGLDALVRHYGRET
jgi:hypothetical protein